MIECPSTCDQIEFCAFHSILLEVQRNGGGMRNNNLEIRIAVSPAIISILAQDTSSNNNKYRPT